MNNAEAIRRIGKLQGTLMKMVAQLETCKLQLVGAGAPDIEDRRIDEWLRDYQKM